MASILIIEDNAPFAETLLLALTTMGHSGRICPNGKAGLKYLETSPVDLIVTDVVMPEADGIEVLMELRSQHSATPVIVMSGDAPTRADLYLSIAEKLGAVRSLLKPFALATFAAAVTEALTGDHRAGRPEVEK